MIYYFYFFNMPNYSKTVLYKIVCKDINIIDIYIGHTTNFNKRKIKHKSRCNNEKNKSYNLKVYQFIRNNGGFENWKIIIIEDYPCENKLEAKTRERYWIEELKPLLNSNIPGRTQEERYNDNKEIIAEYQKEYREINKEILCKQKKEYYEINKQLIAEQKKEYRKQNKEIIAKKKKENITCECGCIITKSNISAHKKTQKHLSLLKLETDGNTN